MNRRTEREPVILASTFDEIGGCCMCPCMAVMIGELYILIRATGGRTVRSAEAGKVG